MPRPRRVKPEVGKRYIEKGVPGPHGVGVITEIDGQRVRVESCGGKVWSYCHKLQFAGRYEPLQEESDA